MLQTFFRWQVQACGSLVTEEHPYAMVVPIELFLMGFGFYRQTHFATSSSNGSNPASPSNRSCIAPELLSPESLGIKLKPIKTRADIVIWQRRRYSSSHFIKLHFSTHIGVESQLCTYIAHDSCINNSFNFRVVG